MVPSQTVRGRTRGPPPPPRTVCSRNFGHPGLFVATKSGPPLLNIVPPPCRDAVQ